MQLLDTAIHVATPEGVELHLRAAGPVPRALAWLLDLCWRVGILLMLAMLLMPLPDGIHTGLMLLAWFALEWLVPAWFEAKAGYTPGKKALGLIVVRDDASPCTWGPALTRNLLRFADFLPLLYMGGLISMLGNRDFKRLGDWAAGTVVVYAHGASSTRQIPLAPSVRPLHALSLDEQRSVLDFAERAPSLGPARAHEIASIATSLLRPGASSPVEQLTQVANFLAGTRVAHAPD